MTIIVIDGGPLGAKLVAKLRGQGRQAAATSPEDGVNSLTGEGIAEALVNASVVIDVSEPPSVDDAAALEFFRSALAAGEHPRTVVTDPHARFFGTELGDRTLLPGAGAVLGPTRYRDWPGPTSPLEER